MENLKNMGAPLQYDGRLRGWRYTTGFFFSDRFPFTPEEMLHLRVGVEFLSNLHLVDSFKKMPDALRKMEHSIRRWSEHEMPRKSVFFDPLPKYEGTKYLSFFLEAIQNNRRTEFKYHAFHAENPKEVCLDPYFLRFYDRRWYVGGYSHDPLEGFIRTFPLERIVGDPQVAGFFHSKMDEYDAEMYWKYIYGITVPPNGKTEDVILKFTPIQGKYFLNTPFFEPFEVLENTQQHLLVRLHLIPNIDLERKLGSFGNQVKVLSPTKLAESMLRFHKEAAKNYETT